MTTARRVLLDLVWLVLLLLPAVVGKALLSATTVGMSVDGGYYTDVARFVRDGRGLLTNISPYHQGIPSFPHPSSIYPIWPLLYGWTARLLPIEIVGHWLPALLYLTTLLGAFLLGRRLAPADLFGRWLPGLHAGHLFVLVLGLHREFWIYTSLPYTEGLAFTLLTFFLWRVADLAPRRTWTSALEIGAWLGLLFLARSQFIIVALAFALAFALRVAVGVDRLRSAGRATLALAVFAAAGGAWLLWVRTFIPDAGLGTLLRFDQAQVTHVLSPLRVMVKIHGLFDAVGDRLSGVEYAWSPYRRNSYARAFYTFHWALPLALPLALVAAWRGRQRFRELACGKGLAWLILGLVALGGLLSVHLPHKVYFGEWYFHRRQAIIAGLAFAPALLVLLRSRRRAVALLGVAILLTSLPRGVRELVTVTAESMAGRTATRESFDELVAWLDDKAQQDGAVTVALMAPLPQRVGWRTTGVGYHWFHERTSYDDLLAMTDQLGARWVIFRPADTRGWKFRSSPALLSADFRELTDRPDGFVILARR